MSSQYILFRINEEKYAIDISHIQEIIKMKEICSIPNGSRKYLKGVINVRGDILPVISLAERLGFDQLGETKFSRIIILNFEDNYVGVIVDGIIKVETLELNDIPDSSSDNMKKNFSNLSYLGEQIISILNLHNILELGVDQNER